MRLLAIDVASDTKHPKNGWAFWDGKQYTSGNFAYTSPTGYTTTLLELVKKYNPQCIFYTDSHGRYNVTRAHSRLHAYIDWVADEMGIQTINNINEKHARLVVLGYGNASKQDTMAYFKEDNEDRADAKLLIECYLTEYQNE